MASRHLHAHLDINSLRNDSLKPMKLNQITLISQCEDSPRNTHPNKEHTNKLEKNIFISQHFSLILARYTFPSDVQ